MMTMRRLLVSCAVLFALQSPLLSRAQDKDAKPADATPPAATPKEESSVTDHTVRIAGQTVPYKATAATILLKNEKDEATALIYFTAYTRSDVKDLSQRPVAF